MVAAIAPGKPAICQPMKVADEKTGPGVNCPTAMASINSCLLNIPVFTSSASKNAKSTYPLPYNMEPILRNIQKSFQFKTSAENILANKRKKGEMLSVFLGDFATYSITPIKPAPNRM